MEMIGLLCPALVSVLIKCNKSTKFEQGVLEGLFRYGIYVLINVFLTGIVITYGLGISGVTSDALCSFPFFIKYTAIALIMAILVPYIEEIISKYIKITLVVSAYDKKTEDIMEDCQ